jgi:hypothetical protein
MKGVPACIPFLDPSGLSGTYGIAEGRWCVLNASYHPVGLVGGPIGTFTVLHGQ